MDIRPKAGGKKLLLDEGAFPHAYRFSAYVTNLTLPMTHIWTLYKNRGDAENRIKELKYAFGVDNFCLSRFFPTKAAFRFIMVAYHLLSLFRQIVLKEKNQKTLTLIRFQCFALGAWITHHSRQKALNLALAKHKRQWMDGLFDTLNKEKPPFSFSNA